MKKFNSKMNALPIVAATYADKFGVKVNVVGNSAYTDGKSINLPVLKKKGITDALWGFLAHEAAHVRHTNFNSWNKIQSPLIRNLANIFEDTRIERKMIEDFPGTKQTLDAALQSIINDGGLNLPEGCSPATILDAHCLIWSRYNVCGQNALESQLKETTLAVKEAFEGTGVYTRLSALLRKVAGLTSTNKAIKLAEDVVKMLSDEA